MSLNIDGTLGTRYGTAPPTQIRPYDFGTDAIERQRVSLGQAMMDADFEYGLQATKWQSYVDIRKFPSFFEVPGTDFTFSNIVSDGASPCSNITIYYSNVVQGTTQVIPPIGSFISVFGLSQSRTALSDRAEGYYIITASNTGGAAGSSTLYSNSANYIAKSWVPAGNIQSNFTFSRRANVFNSGTCVVPFANIWSDGSSNLQVFTSNAHGLLPGFPLTANNLGNAGYSNFFGTFYVSNVTSSNSFNIVANNYIFGATGATQFANLTSSNATLYIGQFASINHRPYDGGVLLNTLSPAHGSTVIRQSKKAFRYQSGKGILFSSGTLFCPQLDIASINIFGITQATTGGPYNTTTQPLSLQVASSTGFIVGQTIASYLGPNLGTVTVNAIPDATHININWTNTAQTATIPIGTLITVLPAGSNIQIVTDIIHGIPQPGATAIIRNFTTSQFNGTYTITGVIDSRTVNVQSQTALTSTVYNLGDQPRLVIQGWHGASVRAGCFEDPNGLFWEYDGQTLAVVRRQSTFATAGYVTVTPQSQTLLGTLVPGVTGAITLTGDGAAQTNAINPGDTQTVITLTKTSGTYIHTVQQSMQNYIQGLGQVWVVGQVDYNQITIGFMPTTYAIPAFTPPLVNWTLSTTRFQDQLKVNDRFTIRGMVHQVTSIQGQGVLTFNPPYRGTSSITAATPVKCCKIKELRVPQAQFNRDTIDGRGPSGYKVDLSRQQMIGIQYTWYGAGFVDFMIRGPDGNWLMVHRIKNNNVNDEAYMRSGNLPVRYELSVESRGAMTSLLSNLNTSSTIISVNDPTTYFPSSNAVLLIDNELISYTSTNINCFLGCTRAAPLNYNISDTARTFTGQSTGPNNALLGTTHLANTSVNLISCTATPTLTHWGSSFLTDGGFDSERGYYFNFSNTNVILGGVNVITVPLTAGIPGAATGDTLTFQVGTIGNTPTISGTPTTTAISVALQSGSTTAPIPAGTLVTDVTRSSFTAIVAVTVPTGTASPFSLILSPVTSQFNIGDVITYSAGGPTGTNTVTAITVSPPSLTVSYTGTFATLASGVAISDATTGSKTQVATGGVNSVVSSSASAFAIRLAPSVTNGLVGDLGTKELLNRAQLLLQRLEATSPVNMQTIGFLNPTGVILNPANWVNINNITNGTQPSFAQYYPGNLISGVPQPGERIFQTIVQAANQNNLDLTGIKELTNGCIGGNQCFPDGPDVLLIFCTNLTTTTASAQINLFWTEAQA